MRVANLPFEVNSNSNSVVLSDGTIIVPYQFEDSRQRAGEAKPPPKYANGGLGRYFLGVHRSTDGGQSLEDEAGYIGYWSRSPLDGFPVLAADATRTQLRDRLYAVWSNTDSGGHQVLFCSSQDGGKNWTKPAIISEQAEGEADQTEAAHTYSAFMPAIAVNTKGVIGVSWYDTRSVPSQQHGWDARFRASLDGGETWLSSVRVSRATSLFKASDSDDPGDTSGIAADANGAFHPVWIDNRTGIRQAWTATVVVKTKTALLHNSASAS